MKRFNLWRKNIIFLLLLAIAGSLYAEKIYLKDGGVVRGRVVKETDTEVILANEYGNISIEKANIDRREGEKSDIPSFANSQYSFTNNSWPKYAFVGSFGVGLVVTTLFMDSIEPLGLILSASLFGTSVLTFAALDYFIYGRVPLETKKKFNVSALQLSPAEIPHYVLASQSIAFYNSPRTRNGDEKVQNFTVARRYF